MALQQLIDSELRELALFAGAGGGILGGKLLGWRTVCAVEIEEYPRRVLLARQADGCLEPFPIWDDIKTFDGKPWSGCVDIVTGGFPCQDISAAGKGAGITGERSGLWSEMARVIREVGPRFVLVENSPMLTSRGLGTVLGDLAEMGFDAEWCVLGAHHAGAPHKRDRIWILANTNSGGCRQERLGRRLEEMEGEWANERLSSAKPSQSTELMADADYAQREKMQRAERKQPEYSDLGGSRWWKTEPDVGRVANGVASRVDRLKAIGNGQVPAVVKLAWETLTQ